MIRLRRIAAMNSLNLSFFGRSWRYLIQINHFFCPTKINCQNISHCLCFNRNKRSYWSISSRPSLFINVEFKNEVIYMDPLEKLWTVLNFKGLTSTVQSPMSGVQRREFIVQGSESSVQSPTSTIQHPESSVQSPMSRVQSPTSRVQRPTLASRVQEFWYALTNLVIFFLLIKRKFIFTVVLYVSEIIATVFFFL